MTPDDLFNLMHRMLVAMTKTSRKVDKSKVIDVESTVERIEDVPIKRVPHTAVFVQREGDTETWKAILDDKMIAADFNSRGAAEAGIEVERKRRANKT